jgi:hypothetical protein
MNGRWRNFMDDGEMDWTGAGKMKMMMMEDWDVVI